MTRLDIERQKELEPKRYEFAKNELTNLGFQVYEVSDSQLSILFKGKTVTLYPYSGWHSGSSIKDGRGINKLLKQLK